MRLLLILIVIGLFVTPILGGSTSTVYASGGSMTYSHVVSMERSDDKLNWPVFGANNTGSPYTYDGSQASVLTLGRTSMTRNTKVDPSSSNFYATEGTVAGDHMINAEDTAGMLNVRPNEPENMCDTEGFLIGTGTDTGAYPVSESYEGRVGVMMHGGGVYESEVGLNDGDVHLASAADMVEKGYMYQNIHTTSMKGFDKNTTGLNAVVDEHLVTFARTAIKGEEEETHAKFVHDYDSFTDAYDELIDDLVKKQSNTVTSISAERVNETVNETEINETELDE